jgi:flagellar protein FliO/FliZ
MDPHDHRGAACLIALIPLAFVFQPSAAGAEQGGVMVDTLFGEGQSGLKVVFFVTVVLVLLALAFWLLRRFGGRRLGSAATRGRQPRLGVIDQATVDGRRRLVLIRRDNVEHLLIVGGPTDVVVEQKIVRAATALREAAPIRPPAAAHTLPRVPLGEDTTWPLQPEPAPKLEPAPRVEPSLRAEQAPRPQRPPAAAGPGKSDDARTAAAAPKVAGEPTAAETEAFMPPPPFPRLDTALRRPLETDNIRAVATAPKTPSEPAAPATDEARAATPADPSRPAGAARTDAKPAPQKSFFDSLEQEMAGLLNRPPKP